MQEPNGTEITAAVESWARDQSKKIDAMLDAAHRPLGPLEEDRRWGALAANFRGLANEMRALRRDNDDTETDDESH